MMKNDNKGNKVITNKDRLIATLADYTGRSVASVAKEYVGAVNDPNMTNGWGVRLKRCDFVVDLDSGDIIECDLADSYFEGR